jgi:hypothetical protein
MMGARVGTLLRLPINYPRISSCSCRTIFHGAGISTRRDTSRCFPASPVLYFTKLEYLSFTSEGGHIVALIDIGVRGTDRTIVISEHWDIADHKAVRLRVAYFDPKVLLDQFATRPNA